MPKFKKSDDPYQKPGPGRPRLGPNGSPTMAHQQAMAMITEPRCKVCKSAYRTEIDKMLILGFSQREVITYFNRIEPNLNLLPSNVSIHARKHMTLKDVVVRKVIEAKAKEQMQTIDDAVGSIMTREALEQIMLHKGYEHIIAGNVLVEPDSMIKLMDRMDKREAEQKSTSIDEMRREVMALVTAVKRNVPEELWQKIYKDFELELEATDPTALMKEAAGISSPKEIESTATDDDDYDDEFLDAEEAELGEPDGQE